MTSSTDDPYVPLTPRPAAQFAPSSYKSVREKRNVGIWSQICNAVRPATRDRKRLRQTRFHGLRLRTSHTPWWTRHASPCNQASLPACT